MKGKRADQPQLFITLAFTIMTSVLARRHLAFWMQPGMRSNSSRLQAYKQCCFETAPRRPAISSSTLLSVRGGASTPLQATNSNSSSRIIPTKKITPDSRHHQHRVYLAVGSNLGDRFHNIHMALELLVQETQSRIVRSSFLHQTAPMYVTDQPVFWNGAVAVETDWEPADFLDKLKDIESRLGRNLQHGIRNGPRPVDLDILFYQQRTKNHHHHHDQEWVDLIVNSTNQQLHQRDLEIPHPRIQERDFVLLPLLDIVGQDFHHPVLNATVGELWEEYLVSSNDAGESASASPVRILPLPRGRSVVFNETVIMGILNVTPDSFSDGGLWSDSIDQAVSHALDMQDQGAGIIDIGGESTRPGAEEVLEKEEIQRTVPVIKAIRRKSDIPISIDTRRAAVARAAVVAGADIVNDVSGGNFDPHMMSTVAELRVPLVLMHMRGTPKTMQSLTDYDDVVSDVSASLQELIRAAEDAGIPRWLQVIDPGIGFAKDLKGNLRLLRHLGQIRSATGNLPVLLGTSRKGFIGKITGVSEPADRDFGSIASCVAAICFDYSSGLTPCNILRVHNVAATVQATKVMDAMHFVE